LSELAEPFLACGIDIPRDVIREFTREKIDLFATTGEVKEIGHGDTIFDFKFDIPEDVRLLNQVMKAITFEFVIFDHRTTSVAFKGTEVLTRLFTSLQQNALGDQGDESDGRSKARVDRYLLFPRGERDEVKSLADDPALVSRYVCDYLASMTEGQAMGLYARLFEPMAGFSTSV
jgi:dGTP triphosphohydrolase